VTHRARSGESPSGRRAQSRETESRSLSTVCRHLALVAVDGATDEVALTLDPGFVLHLNGVSTDRWGYLALIEANRALHATRPPLDVRTASARRRFVTVSLIPRCVAHFQLEDELIVRLWMTPDWRVWSDWLLHHDMT
jgi:hypothetical protein